LQAILHPSFGSFASSTPPSGGVGAFADEILPIASPLATVCSEIRQLLK
jgi:hypothetical protein